MNILDYLLIFIVIYAVYICYQKMCTAQTENFYNDYPKEFQTEDKENIYDDTMKYIDLILKSKHKHKVNPYFMENQFNINYKDTISAFDILIPNQKQLFNRSDMPIINISTPSNDEIKNLIKNFIKETNNVLDKNVDDFAIRDWKENYLEKDHDSGWDKQQEKLGIPGSIYTKPAKKAHIKLIKIDKAERFETEDEIKYTVFLVIQKLNTEDQMMVKVSFQIDKQDINLEREFFDKNKDTYQTIVKIEEVFIMGYLTKHSYGKKSIKNEYYNFDGVTDGRMFSQKQIMTELNKKRKQYAAEC